MSEAKTKTIYGQAWVQGDSLVQEQLLVSSDPKIPVTENVISLIDNIWDNLTTDKESSTYGYKTNGKKYFYWEVDMTDVGDDTLIHKVKIECPKPKPGLFEEPYDPDKVSGDYAIYWVGKLKTADENNKASFAVQQKSVTFPSMTYYNHKEENVELPEIKVENNDLGDITNLLGLF